MNYRISVNEVGEVHLQVRLGLLKNLKRKYGVYPPPPTHHGGGGGGQLHLLTSGNTAFFAFHFEWCQRQYGPWVQITDAPTRRPSPTLRPF